MNPRAGGRALLMALAITGANACAVTTPRPIDPPSTKRGDVTGRPTPTFRLTMFDVGTGLSVLVDGDDFTLLYDAGSNDDYAGENETRAAAYLVDVLGPSGPEGCGGSEREHLPKKTLSHVVLSHPHNDHLSLFPEVFRCFDVENVWDSGFPGKTKGYRAFLTAASASGAKSHLPREGERVDLGRDASFVVLHVDGGARDENAASIVLSLRLGKKTVLFMGDAEGGARDDWREGVPPSKKSVEGELVARWGTKLDADVLIVGHHGSKTSSRTPFLDLVSPEIALISSGPHGYGAGGGVVLPDAQVVEALRARAKVYRTDTEDDACREASTKVGRDADGKPGGCNAITLHFDGGRIEVDSREKR